MSDHESKQQIIEKIRKLIRLSKSSNMHEAERAAEMASKLMEKWRLSAASVQEVEDIQSGKEEIVRVSFVVPNNRMKLKWLETLGLACATLFDGTILVNARLHGTSWTWVGFETEIPLMEELFCHLWSCYPNIVEFDLQKAKDDAADRYPIEVRHMANFTPAQTMKFKHGHGQGFAMSLCNRCAKIVADRKAAAAGVERQWGLVLVRDNALAKWRIDSGAKYVTRKQTVGDSRGFVSGYQRGQSIPLGKSIQ